MRRHIDARGDVGQPLRINTRARFPDEEIIIICPIVTGSRGHRKNVSPRVFPQRPPKSVIGSSIKIENTRFVTENRRLIGSGSAIIGENIARLTAIIILTNAVGYCLTERNFEFFFFPSRLPIIQVN